MSYISELQIDYTTFPIGSSLYGDCENQASAFNKIIDIANFDTFINGVTIHVKFIYGNSAPLVNPLNNSQHLTLQVGTTDPRPISNPGGTIMWSPGAVISFTYDSAEQIWSVNDSDSGSGVIVDQQYISNSSNAISGAGVTGALNTLGAAARKAVDNSISDSGSNANSTNLPTTEAVINYIQTKTNGLTGSMRFIGISSTIITNGGQEDPTIEDVINTSRQNGDVVLYLQQEYVWNGTTWQLLGDEGSYALKTNTEDVIKTATFTPDVPGVLTTKETLIPNVISTGSAATFSVASGVLSITTGSAPTLGTAITVKEVDNWTAGSAASLNTTTQTVVIPNSNS